MTLCLWLADPKPTRLLGTAIVREMTIFTPTLALEVEWEEELRGITKENKTTEHYKDYTIYFKFEYYQ